MILKNKITAAVGKFGKVGYLRGNAILRVRIPPVPPQLQALLVYFIDHAERRKYYAQEKESRRYPS